MKRIAGRMILLSVVTVLAPILMSGVSFANEDSSDTVEDSGLEFSIAKAEIVNTGMASYGTPRGYVRLDGYLFVTIKVNNKSNKNFQYVPSYGHQISFDDDLGNQYYSIYLESYHDLGMPVLAGEATELKCAFQKPRLQAKILTLNFPRILLKGFEEAGGNENKEGIIKIPFPMEKIAAKASEYEADFKKEVNVDGLVFFVNDASLVNSSSGMTSIAVTLKVVNGDNTKKIDLSEGFSYRMADNFSNEYRMIGESSGFGKKAKILPDRFPSFYPGESYTETVFFEPPIESVKFLIFKINASSVGIKNEIKINIPADMIAKAPEKPVAAGSGLCGNGVCNAWEDYKSCAADCANMIYPFASDVDSCIDSTGKQWPATGPGAATWFVWNSCSSQKSYRVTPGKEIILHAYTDACDSCVCNYPDFCIFELMNGAWQKTQCFDFGRKPGAATFQPYTPFSEQIKITADRCFYLEVLRNKTDLRESRALIREPSAKSLTFISDNTWEVLSYDGRALGHAQFVCLDGSDPSMCSSGAKNYNWPGGGWGAELSSIQGARWIWAPDKRGVFSDLSLATFIFRKKIDLPMDPISGAMWIAVDDSAEVWVNGRVAGTAGSFSDISEASRAQASLKMFDILPFLHRGKNEISVLAHNGPSFYAQGAERQPAGVVFGGLITFGELPEGG
jgi:hypothetical protein